MEPQPLAPPQPLASPQPLALRTQVELKKMITDVDADGSGSVEFPEFLQMMTAKMGSSDSKEDVVKVFKMFDEGGAGKIDFKALRKVAKELGENLTDDELQVAHTTPRHPPLEPTLHALPSPWLLDAPQSARTHARPLCLCLTIAIASALCFRGCIRACSSTPTRATWAT